LHMRPEQITRRKVCYVREILKEACTLRKTNEFQKKLGCAAHSNVVVGEYLPRATLTAR
jgi:hypothetical protein